MKSYLIIATLLLLSYCANSQIKFGLQPSFGLSIPLSDYANKEYNELHLYDNGYANMGYELALDAYLKKKKFSFGSYFIFEKHNYNETKINEYYDNWECNCPGFDPGLFEPLIYDTLIVNNWKHYSIGLFFSYNIKVKHIEFSPTFRGGLNYINAPDFLTEVRKQEGNMYLRPQLTPEFQVKYFLKENIALYSSISYSITFNKELNINFPYTSNFFNYTSNFQTIGIHVGTTILFSKKIDKKITKE